MKLNKIKLLLTVTTTILFFSFTGCGETTINVNVENSSELSGTTLGIDSLIEIGDKLWYDSTTRIVYWWNGTMGAANCATTPTAYYAPNGLPYRYNPETNTFEEIIYNE